jgi:hypothetical protein
MGTITRLVVKKSGDEFSFDDIELVKRIITNNTNDWQNQGILKNWGYAVYMVEFHDTIKPHELEWFNESCERMSLKVYNRMRDLVRDWAKD